LPTLAAQIPGCLNDLSRSKRYYQRFRLCGDHLHASMLVVNGVQSRFCQKCTQVMCAGVAAVAAAGAAARSPLAALDLMGCLTAY
jgi:hypothetical protein